MVNHGDLRAPLTKLKTGIAWLVPGILSILANHMQLLENDIILSREILYYKVNVERKQKA